ncbi:hypothetical protein F5878DRAFT_643834 [Lentinula raphanica]|uniref:Uncharacterized protein n=1 Tax=Lentinula raphanica TaxID=153919 RepID=A0AA38UBF3_9AGAR|nr:hypothetical protein F5878DRAFT_643834 [Lentinula raphanica]
MQSEKNLYKGPFYGQFFVVIKGSFPIAEIFSSPRNQTGEVRAKIGFPTSILGTTIGFCSTFVWVTSVTGNRGDGNGEFREINWCNTPPCELLVPLMAVIWRSSWHIGIDFEDSRIASYSGKRRYWLGAFWTPFTHRTEYLVHLQLEDLLRADAEPARPVNRSRYLQSNVVCIHLAATYAVSDP